MGKTARILWEYSEEKQGDVKKEKKREVKANKKREDEGTKLKREFEGYTH